MNHADIFLLSVLAVLAGVAAMGLLDTVRGPRA